MSRHRGIALAALGAVLVHTLAACSGSGEANPTPPNTSRPSANPTSTTTSSTRSGPYSPAPFPTETRKIDVTVTHPKHVDENTPCHEVITSADVGAATEAVVGQSSSGRFFCHYSVNLYQDSGAGRVAIFFRVNDPAVWATVTTLSGNTAVEERLDERVCTSFVALVANKPLIEHGAVLSVTATLSHGVDPCKAARELVEKGFARLPDA